MSQHQIILVSPDKGDVLVTAGIDPMLDEAFLNYIAGDVCHMSPPGMSIDDIPAHAQAQLGVPLPQQVIDALRAEMADWRTGATDIGRRIRRYRSDGALIESLIF